ncbi:divalent-cation tolerance protein CutA [Polaromonas sp.]|uniref:divalent-cation tolerance protein CutA n=1 Tax=Polaromonas sp. TaxID=1869339 RepID=UPI0017C6DD0C|nr:divalent-cation tolerance protein CutA [Polaromonas sp.]NMM07205.1 divalent-cation tolerance protein CutA [Polaromonas sp.]
MPEKTSAETPSPSPSPTTTAYCMVQTALASEAQAEALARLIVGARLGACVQLQPIRSFYRWQNEVRDESEFLLQIKTRQACYPALEAFIRAHHSYETPEIVQLPITAGSADYLQWLQAETGG